MKYSKLLLFFAGLFAFSFNSNISSSTSECNTYFPLTVGMKWTMKSMDKKGKETGRNSMKVLNTKPSADGLIYMMESEFKIEGEEELRKTSFEYTCDNNVLKFNMDQFLTDDMQKNEAITFDIDTDGMELPSSLEAGQKLKDATVHIVGKMETMKVIDMTVTVSDRLVEKFESVTTEAGTYECAKITSKTHMKFAFMNSTTSSIQWISDKVGIVKSEEYDKKGKLDSSSELVEFSR